MIHEVEAVLILDHELITMKDVMRLSKNKKFLSFVEQVVEAEMRKQTQENEDGV